MMSHICAIELYDGPFFRILRKENPSNIDIMILSAKYGLIHSNQIISYYDQILSPKKAKELSKGINEKLTNVLENGSYSSIYITLGKNYMPAMEDSLDILNRNNAIFAQGCIGERLHGLKVWLSNIRDLEKE